MRKDMNKVVTERPRTGGRGKSSKRFEGATKPREKRYVNNIPVDLSPKKESMRKRHLVNNNSKEFTDLLGPLQKFLLSKVGEKWNDVWSEICAVLKGNGWQANHIKDHVKRDVKGISHSGLKTSDYGFPEEPQRGLVYVDNNGVLQKGEGYRRYKRKERIYPYVIESDTTEYHKINGCWFKVVGERYFVIRIEIDPFSKKPRERKEEAFNITKKALSRGEAKKLNLVNRLSTEISKMEKYL